MLRTIALIAALLSPAGSFAQNTDAAEPAMTIERLAEIVQMIDGDALFVGNQMQFTLDDIPVLVIADPVADRMRAMIPIRSAAGLDPDELMRLMQANFDSALDARYAVAQGRLWGVFIHPLAPLEREQFLSGIAQTLNVARSYGRTYSSGAGHFGGGDSGEIYRQLLKDLLERGQEL